MIPTNEIEALRDRAQVALDPLPYQQARLLPKLRQDRPLRFAVMTERPDVLAELLHEVHATATCDAPLVPFAGLIHDLGPATAHEREMQLPALWPAGQIVELCDAVLERRVVGGGNDGPAWLLDPSPLRPMAKVGALDGVRATHGRDTTREVLADFTDQVEPPARFFGVDYADDPLDPEAKIEADGANEWFRKTLAKRINAGKITYSDEPLRALRDAAEKALARTPRPFARLEAKLDALPFVESVSVESNHAMTECAGIPGKGVRITIGPQTLESDECTAIAQAIHDELPFGIATSGEWCGHVGCSITGGRSVYWNWAKPTVLVGGVDFATDPPAATVATFAVTDAGPVLLDVHELEPEDPTR